MKKLSLSVAAFGLVSLSVFLLLGTAPRADERTSTQAPQVQTQVSAASQAEVKTFMGTIAKDGDQFTLKVDASTWYQLDDQDNASKFDGKQVKVTGTLDASNRTIHVQKIEAVA